MTVNFTASKKKIEYYDVKDFYIWDTARDSDGGRWKEYYRKNTRTTNEGEKSFVRTEMPSSLILIARAGDIEIHDFTTSFTTKYQKGASTVVEIINGPIPDNAVCKVAAAEGVIAVSTEEAVFLFDMVNRQIIEINVDGTYLLKGPPMNGVRWESYDKILIGEGMTNLDGPLGNIATSRAVHLYSERGVGKGVRPFVFVEGGDRVFGIRPDLKIIEFFETGWGYVDSLKCLPDGTLTFRAGVDSDNVSSLLFKPSSWYYSLGTGQAEDHSASLVADLLLSTGNDEIGYTYSDTGRMIVEDTNVRFGGSRIFHGKGFSTKVPGVISQSLLAEDDPEVNVTGNTDADLNGTLSLLALRGHNFFHNWSSGNWIEVTEDSATWDDSWAMSMFAFAEESISSGTQYLAEYGHAPGGYVNSAARIVVEDGIIKFQTSNDGWSTIDCNLEFGEMPSSPVALSFAMVSSLTSSMVFASVDGIIKTARGASPSYNASSMLSIGRARDGSGAAADIYISNFTVGHGFGHTAFKTCVYENIESVSELYSASELHGAYHSLIGGDDEFGVYGVITDSRVCMFRDGLLTSVQLSSIGLANVEIIKTEMKGWRFGLQVFDTTELDTDVWVSPGSLSFSRSDFEDFLTGPPNEDRSSFKFKEFLADEEDHIGPILPVLPGEVALFKISAKIMNLHGGSSTVSGEIIVDRLNTSASLATVTTELTGNTDAITVDSHEQGAYIILTDTPANEKVEWFVEIKRA